MACSLSHTDSEIEALVQKLIDEDKGRQNAIMDLALQFENSCTAKDDLRNAYEKCNDISQKSRAWIDSFLKEGSAKDYELNFSMYEKAAKLEKQMDAKSAWLLKKYYYRSQENVDDSDIHLTHVLRSSSSVRVEPSPYTLNSVTIIPDPAGIVQLSTGTCVEPSSLTPNPVRIIPGPAGVVQRKLEQVVAIVKSCSPNVFGDLNVTIKDLSGTISETVHHKVIGDGGYGNDITVRAVMILANVSVFTPKPLENYFSITKRNMVKKPPMPPISSYQTVDESVEEHDTCDEYLTERFLTEKEQQQLAQDEEAYKEYLEEEANAEKERARAEKEWEEDMKKEETHNELFRLKFGVISDSEYETD
nr:hypothetical protein [Tanacetum cinerariifolium]